MATEVPMPDTFVLVPSRFFLQSFPPSSFLLSGKKIERKERETNFGKEKRQESSGVVDCLFLWLVLSVHLLSIPADRVFAFPRPFSRIQTPSPTHLRLPHLAR